MDANVEYAADKGGMRYDSSGAMVETPESARGQYCKVGKRLQMLRKVNGYTLIGAAHRCRMSAGELRAIEAGAKPVGAKQLSKICEVYGIEPGKLLKG